MNVDDLRARLQNAAEPAHALVPPLRDLHRRGRRRTRQRSGLLVAAAAATLAVVLGGVQHLDLLSETPASPPSPGTSTALPADPLPMEPFADVFGGFRLASQEAGQRGQTDFTPRLLSRVAGDELSVACTSRDGEHRQVLVTSAGDEPQLLPCSRYPTIASTLGGFGPGGAPLDRSTPIRLRLVDLTYQLGAAPPPPLDDPTSQLAVAVYRP